jgi:O-antigen/teichoic acid export membrane protein
MLYKYTSTFSFNIPIFVLTLALMKIRLIIRSEFFKNVFTLVSGTTFTQIISVAVYFILSRLYTDEDFGIFALYMSILAITNITATGKYELAIMMPEKDSKGLVLTGLSSTISILVSILLLVLVALFGKPFSRALGNESIAPWLWLLPISTFLNGIYQSLNYWSNRKKRFRTITGANVGQSLTNSAMKLGGGALMAGPFGLILGSVLGQITGFLVFLVNFIKNDRSMIRWMHLDELKKVAREYYRFPKYNMLHGVVNGLSGNLPVFVLTSWFSTAAAGLYAFGLTMVFRPMNLVTTAFSQVFSQRVIKKNNERDFILPDVKALLWRMFQLSIIPFGLVAVFAPAVFSFAFGSDWETAGEYTRILIPWLYVLFLSAPFSFLPDIFHKQGTALVIDSIKLAVRLGAMVVGVYLGDIFVTLILFSAGSMLLVSYQLIWYYNLAKSADRALRSEVSREKEAQI